jgi:hypothetical protein
LADDAQVFRPIQRIEDARVLDIPELQAEALGE